MKYIYVFEGAVASGKTTCLQNLEKIFKCRVFYENWEVDNESLKTMYTTESGEQARIANMSFQLQILSRFWDILGAIREDTEHQLFLIDRGILGSLSFVWNGMTTGMLNKFEDVSLTDFIINQWLSMVNHVEAWGTFIVIYLDAEPYECFHRYMKRTLSEGRVYNQKSPVTLWGEELDVGINEGNLKRLKQWDYEWKKFLKRYSIPVSIVDADASPLKVCGDAQEIIYVDMEREHVKYYYYDKENFI